MSHDVKVSKASRKKHYTGLLPRLNGIFYEGGVYQKRSKAHLKKPKSGKKKNKKSADTKKPVEKKKSEEEYGIGRGRKVHREIELSVKASKKGKRAPGKKLKFTHKFFHAMRTWNWICQDAEVIAYDHHLKMYTKADVIVMEMNRKDRTKPGDLVMLEVKTGYPGFMDEMGMMKGPLSWLPDTHLNRAFLQLMLTREMVMRTYGKYIAKAYVVKIDEDGVLSYPLPKEIVDEYYSVREHLKMIMEAGKTE